MIDSVSEILPVLCRSVWQTSYSILVWCLQVILFPMRDEYGYKDKGKSIHVMV